MSRKDRIALIVPAYNEEATILQTLEAFKKHQPDILIYAIDNNSRDRTTEHCANFYAKNPGIGELLSEPKQGKAQAVRKAFLEIEADVFVMVDADMTYPAEALDKLLKPVLDGSADMVVGDRISGGQYAKENKRLFHSFGNGLVTWLINKLFKAKLKDIMSGYRVFSRSFVKTYPIDCSGFELETEMTLHALTREFTVKEIAINYQDRPADSFSKLDTYRDGYKILRKIFWIFKDYKPLAFFTSLSVLAFLGGVAAGIPVILEFLDTQYVSHVPLAILATGLMIFSLLLFSVGLVLDTVVKLGHQQFYWQLMNQAPYRAPHKISVEEFKAPLPTDEDVHLKSVP